MNREQAQNYLKSSGMSEEQIAKIESAFTCEDAISRQAVEDAIYDYSRSCDVNYAQIMEYIDKLPSVSTEKTDAYKQGWHDAIDMALKEAYTILHYGDIFNVVQEETLIGLGMAYEQVSTEKTGRWEWVQYDGNPNIGNWHCSECRKIIPHMPENTDNTPIYKWCPYCGAKMGGDCK